MEGILIISDKALLEQAKIGDHAAFGQLFDKYWEDLFRMAYKRLRSKEGAEDIVQDVFLSLWNNIQQVEIEGSLGAYLFISLRNKIFNYYEKQSVRLKYLLRQPFNPVQSEDLICSNINSKELRQVVAAEVGRMPPKMKEIYLLSREQHLPVSDIAAMLSIAPQTVKNQLNQALDRIRVSLHKSDLARFIFLF
jgi:RNA polymerase sigma-70 factor (ECF subfamily)